MTLDKRILADLRRTYISAVREMALFREGTREHKRGESLAASTSHTVFSIFGSMNERPTNKGGYFKSEGRRHVLEDILPLFPAWLRDAMKPRSMAEVIDGEEIVYSDPLWVPSATDVFGPGDYWAEERDSEQLEIFKTERGRVKEVEGRGTYLWWLRSPHASNSYFFVYVDTDGAVDYTSAYTSLGFAPGFDL